MGEDTVETELSILWRKIRIASKCRDDGYVVQIREESWRPEVWLHADTVYPHPEAALAGARAVLWEHATKERRMTEAEAAEIWSLNWLAASE